MMTIMTQEITVDSATSIPPNMGMVNAVAASSSSIRNSDRLPMNQHLLIHNFPSRHRELHRAAGLGFAAAGLPFPRGGGGTCYHKYQV